MVRALTPRARSKVSSRSTIDRVGRFLGGMDS